MRFQLQLAKPNSDHDNSKIHLLMEEDLHQLSLFDYEVQLSLEDYQVPIKL